MKILHGTWIPEAIASEFVQKGTFYLWVETDAQPRGRRKRSGNVHPRQLAGTELADFIATEFATAVLNRGPIDREISTRYFILPSTEEEPLPSLEIARYLETEPPEPSQWNAWAVDCYTLRSPIHALNQIHFLCTYDLASVQLGSDLLFWYYYTQFFKQVIVKDQYAPGLKYREIETVKKGKRKTKQKSFEISPIWEIVSEAYESQLRDYVDRMPLACAAGVSSMEDSLKLFDRESLLRHFSECLLNQIVTETPVPKTFEKTLAGSWLLSGCFQRSDSDFIATGETALERYKQWQGWKQKIAGDRTGAGFYICFQLREASAQFPNDWVLNLLVSAKDDPSFKLHLDEYWDLEGQPKKAILKHFGKTFERDLLMNLGAAARIYPKLWQALETDKPTGCTLTLSEALDFLKESAWVLEDAGYKVIVPAWWMRRSKPKLRIKASANSQPASVGTGAFQLRNLIRYQYELSIGGEVVSPEEWQQLVNAKTSLVQFRGEWIELDRSKMQQMLEFWQENRNSVPEVNVLEFIQKAAEADGEIEVEPDETLTAMMQKLRDPSCLQPIDNPQQLQGQLRDYQKRGVAWIQYLEQLGLNGCLADDMGLGKSIQVIAKLLLERESQETVPPTLLIAPTSVVSNWRKEIEKFAPNLTVMVHHGTNRVQEEKAFLDVIANYDVIITSFTLARKDQKIFQNATWQRIVIDEAQNIKNPKAAQTKAILKLEANARLALTGTPVENRLMDLWSIFNFLNPGYLGKQTQFRKAFELPIQKENDRAKSQVLKTLVQPFVLRRVKTDRNIIQDLPDKVEHKQYCNLTKEQASLYEAVVKDVTEQLDEAEGIQRSGLIFSTLMKLKQICNHPRQFLKDNSEFTTGRSHKLKRLGEMIEEIQSEGESLLIFTQFTEIGDALQRYLKQDLRLNTYYIHGGTSAKKRERAIEEFQHPDTEPSAFILSLKAGGVGITLTKANHVFHFDRWWNPAVENQATDRAFRIGQTKNVFVHKFVTVGTVEEQIDRTLEEKEKVASAIVGNDESWLTELDNESFKKLITLNWQTAVL
ncbi:DEAD/DEAH box helicase [Baaleninema simplex]|uniref:DEAD/DEAH box helicase n=1 Tax=Baaleninema simplex TaxID=2862350 RepID=UPI000344ACB1|nr:DEAD/DEAH box helicase [Baaleninema simplex]